MRVRRWFQNPLGPRIKEDQHSCACRVEILWAALDCMDVKGVGVIVCALQKLHTLSEYAVGSR